MLYAWRPFQCWCKTRLLRLWRKVLEAPVRPAVLLGLLDLFDDLHSGALCGGGGAPAREKAVEGGRRGVARRQRRGGKVRGLGWKGHAKFGRPRKRAHEIGVSFEGPAYSEKPVSIAFLLTISSFPVGLCCDRWIDPKYRSKRIRGTGTFPNESIGLKLFPRVETMSQE